ncbi:MAG TPA: glycoside hydrolase domain-containing protein, partial [Edaphobacter sp.]|nr:glycoside hydrolase domain-containing protein [Edaphobacter sp.]
MSQSTQSRRDVLALLGSVAAFTLAPQAHALEAPSSAPEIDEYPYTIADEPWPSLLGNHRVHVYADKPGTAVWAHLPWRRTDNNPEQKAILVYDEHGTEVLNVATPRLEDECGDVVFEAKQPGSFFVYYLPHADIKSHHSALGPKGQYRKPLNRADASWTGKYGSASQRTMQALPKVRVIAFQARTALDSFYPMLVPATRSEVQQLCQKYPRPVLLFPEDREHPIQMDDRLPLRWIQRGPENHFASTVLRG